jgi:hypothetical protein
VCSRQRNGATGSEAGIAAQSVVLAQVRARPSGSEPTADPHATGQTVNRIAGAFPLGLVCYQPTP